MTTVCPRSESNHPRLPRVLVEPAGYQSAVVQEIKFQDIQVSCSCNRRELKPDLHVSLPHPFGAGDRHAAGMVCTYPVTNGAKRMAQDHRMRETLVTDQGMFFNWCTTLPLPSNSTMPEPM